MATIDWNSVIDKYNIIPASYIIYVWNDGKVYARNGTTGNIDFSETSASVVIQNVVNTLTSGGLIFFKRGLYKLTSTLKIPPGNDRRYILQGESSGITKIWAPNINNAIILGDNTDLVWSFGLKDISLDGSTGITDLLTLRNFQFANIDNVQLSKFKTGILLDPYGGSKSAYFSQIKNCGLTGSDISTPKGVGIKFISAESGNYTANSNQIIGGRIRLCDMGTQIQYGDTNLFTGVNFEDNNIGTKLDIRSGVNRLIANRFESNKAWDIQIVAGAYSNLITGNSFNSVNKISNAGTDTIIRDNYGV